MIKKLRFLRSFFFAFRYLILYIVLFFIVRKVLSEQQFENLLYKTNLYFAKRLKKYILRLRGIFIKLGQFISVLSKIFWPEIAKELEDLQDRVPPVPYDVIKSRFLNDFNKTPHEMFLEFDDTPLASASIGQVHIAITKDNQKVAVKALYPGMEDLVRLDLRSIKAILFVTHYFFPYIDMRLINKEFSEMILSEINYESERKNLNDIKLNFKKEEEYIFPDVLDEYSSKTVLTTTFIDGIKINDIDKMNQFDIDSKEVAKLLLKAYSKMFFIDQRFHADPHPGNIFVVPQEDDSFKLAFIDFGSIEIFTNRFRENIPQLLKAILLKDIPGMMDSIENMGFTRLNADREKIETIIKYRFEALENLQIEDYSHLKFDDLTDFYDYDKLNINITEVISYYQIPRNYLYFGRTVSLLIALSAQLDHTVSIFQIAMPYVKDFIFGEEKSFVDFIQQDLKELSQNAIKLPEKSNNLIDSIQRGKLKINVKELDKMNKVIYILGHQFIYALMAITCATFSMVFYLNNKLELSKYFIYAVVFLGIILMYSFFKNRKMFKK